MYLCSLDLKGLNVTEGWFVVKSLEKHLNYIHFHQFKSITFKENIWTLKEFNSF